MKIHQTLFEEENQFNMVLAMGTKGNTFDNARFVFIIIEKYHETSKIDSVGGILLHPFVQFHKIYLHKRTHRETDTLLDLKFNRSWLFFIICNVQCTKLL